MAHASGDSDRPSATPRPVTLDIDQLPVLGRGCAVLGGGGGGDPLVGALMAREAMLAHGPVSVIDLDDLPDDGLVMPCGMFGAPTVTIEKLQSGAEGERLVAEVERLFDRPVVAIMPFEIGGSNGVLPLTWAARMGLPYVDADGMGRAFPTLPQMAMHLAGVPSTPCVLTDERLNTLVIRTDSVLWTERLLRQTAAAFGGSGVAALYMMPVAVARDATVRGSVSRALDLGAAIVGCAADPVAATIDRLDAVELLRGKVVDVDRRTNGGFVRGSVIVQDADPGGRLLRIEIQNENLAAIADGEVRACVPDVISVLDVHGGEAISTECLRYGQRVSVIAFPAAELWRTPRGLEIAGPTAFGYDFPYVGLEGACVRTA